MPLESQKHLFDLAEDVTYLNCAYMSPQLNSVREVGREMLQRKSRPWTISIEDFFQPVRTLKERFAQLIRADSWERIAVIPSASYGLSTVANNLRLEAGQKIIVVEEQFPSNIYPGQRVAEEAGARIQVVGPVAGRNRTYSWNEAILEAIDPDTAMVAMGHVHWADGTLYDLRAIRQKSREAGALLVIDGTQSVGALPFYIDEFDPDALICAGYKWLMGPYATGLAYFGPYFDGGRPLEENWINRLHSEQFGGLVNYQEEYHPLAARYSVGEHSNFQLVPMLSEAIRQLLAWTPEAIQEYCQRISAPALEAIEAAGAQLEPTDRRAHHLFGIRLSSPEATDRLHQKLTLNGVYVSKRGTAIRVSPHVYNSEADFERLRQGFAG